MAIFGWRFLFSVILYLAFLQPMRKLLSVIVLFLLCQPLVWAQQQPQFTHYGFNGMQISPAYAGITNHPEIFSLYRSQWLGYDASFDAGGAPQTLLLSANAPVRLLHGGIGVNLIRDKRGNTTFTTAALSYSYHINIGETGKLGIGIQGNMNNISKGTYRANDPNDSHVPYNSSDSKYDLGAGLWYESEQFYVGGSITNLLRSEYFFQDSTNTGAGRFLGENHVYVTGGINLPVSADVVVTPTALFRYDLVEYSFDVGARATYNEKYWAGLNYRYEEAVSALVGLSLFKDNALRVGYAFDFTTFGRTAKAPTSHEVMLSYRLPEPVVRIRPAIRTPRYFFSK